MAVKNHSIRNNISLFIGKSVNFCLQGNFLQTKDEVINASYFIAFGRAATSIERRYWLKNTSVDSVKQLITYHQKTIAKNHQEQKQVIIRSFRDGMGRLPKQREFEFWSKRPSTFADMLTSHVNWQKEHAEQRMEIINRSYQTVFGRIATVNEISYWMSKSVLTYAQIIAIHATWKMRGQSRSQLTGFQTNINQPEISTFQFSAQALSSMYASGGNYLMSPCGANVVVIGKNSL